ncbi:MAG: hypothetical protein Q4A88_06915 [Clostridia bacterium]|nr:hypothetical protein [Clostridia bacterium]
MKRFLLIALAFLLVLCAPAWGNLAEAEEGEGQTETTEPADALAAETTETEEPEAPYLGVWKVAKQTLDDAVTDFAESDNAMYLELRPEGVVYCISVTADGAEDDYLAYAAAEENQLHFYEDEAPILGVYDPEADTIVVTDGESGLVTELRRVPKEGQPDWSALIDRSAETQTYYGYRMFVEGQTVNMLELLPTMDMDPRDFYLSLNPDGTGYLQFGEDEAGGEITWTDAELTANGESIAYTREGDRISFEVEGIMVEFIPDGEAEARMLLINATKQNEGEGAPITAETVVGNWSLSKAIAMGVEIPKTQIEERGLDLAFQFNEDGTAAMINKGETTEGLNWSLDGSDVKLSTYGTELYTFRYDGEYLVLDVMASLFFGKTE